MADHIDLTHSDYEVGGRLVIDLTQDFEINVIDLTADSDGDNNNNNNESRAEDGDAASIQLWTDGSVIHSGPAFGGAGIAYRRNGQWCGRAIALGQTTGNSGEAEMLAIHHALVLGKSLLAPNARQIELLTDSEECVTRLRSAAKRREFEACGLVRRELDGLASGGVNVSLRWVKGHSGVVGNEIADKLAGYASRMSATQHAPAGQIWDNPKGVNFVTIEQMAVSKGKLVIMSAGAREERRVRRKEQRAATFEDRAAKRAVKRDAAHAANAQRRAHKLSLRLLRAQEQLIPAPIDITARLWEYRSQRASSECSD